ncbi:MAG: sulfotransferase [Actinomycetota bacterium]|nr:sulfotransferase [Actinomycetota bacterium]
MHASITPLIDHEIAAVLPEPNFFLIGAGRAGSTAMSYMLRQHPQIFVTTPKEPHFLAFPAQRLSFKGPGDDLNVNRLAVTDPDEYARLYTGTEGFLARGDASVSTLYYWERSIPTLRDLYPDARLIALLRDPAQRAFSSFQYQKIRGFEPVDDFEEALDLETKRIEMNWQHLWHYTRMSFYHRALEAFTEAVGPDRILILFQEELKQAPDVVLQRTFHFLGVDDTVRIEPITVNVSGKERRPIIQKVIRNLGSAPLLKDITDRIVPYRVRERVRSSNLEQATMSHSAQERLDETFRDDIPALRNLMRSRFSAEPKSLPEWLSSASP